jgi:zinc protease
MLARIAATLLALTPSLPALAAEEKPLPRELPPFGPDRPLPVPRIEQSTLEGGLTLWVVARPGLPRVAAVLAVRGGTAADPRGLEGASEVLAEVLKAGTATRSARQLAEAMQAAGGSLEVQADDDAIFLSASVLARGAGDALAILADVARNASFPDAEVELARANALQAHQVKLSSPDFLAHKALAEALYGDHPYRIVGASPPCGPARRRSPAARRR